MAEEAKKETETERSASAGAESSQGSILDVLSRGLDTAKQQMDARRAAGGPEVQRICILVYGE